MTIDVFLTALALGLASSGHCIFMCGGISCALSQSPEQSALGGLIRLLTFHLGRLSCYALLGIVLGGILGGISTDSSIAATVLRTFAAVLIIAMGLYISGIYQGLKKLEQALSAVWRKIQPLTASLMQQPQASKRFLLGFLWGFLPCGMIYSTVLWASASVAADNQLSVLNAALYAGLLMFTFGLGTLPSLLLLSTVSQQIGRSLNANRNIQQGKKIIGLLLIGFGIWSLLWVIFPMPAFLHGGHQGHGASQNTDHSGMNHATMNHSSMEHSAMEHATADNEDKQDHEMDHSEMDHSSMKHSSMKH